LENNFDGLEYLHILQGKNEIMDELAKLGSSRAMIPTGIFLQELHEPTISKALVKANKAVKSSQETATTRQHNRVTCSHGNSFRLANTVHDISQDKGPTRTQGQMRTIASMGRAIHTSQ
jgi:hypothetical protein